MTAIVRFGTGSTIKFDLNSGSLLADCAAPRNEAVDPVAATSDAIRSPLEFPPLGAAVTPGDQVVLALGRNLPHAAKLIQPIVDVLIENGVAPDGITVLRTREDVEAGLVSPDSALPESVRCEVRVVVHDPELRSELAYLASTVEGHPVYLNRALCDADLVIPIARASCRRSGDALGALDPLFPAFSDADTRRRFASLTLAGSSHAARTNARQEMREVIWLLGILFSVSVVPAAGGGVMAVYAGKPEVVRREARQRCELAWSFAVPRRASLVVAAIEGDAAEQTWESLGRAVAAATRAVSENGAIAICTQLNAEPGPAVRHVGESDDLQRALKRIRKDHPSDALPATQLARAMDRARVYLLSNLDDEVVEELGMAPVSAAEDITRLAARHDTCILLGNAQLAVATPVEDE